MKKIYYYRDQLERNLKKNDLSALLEANDQEIPVGNERILDRLADCMTFGALVKCNECSSGGQFVFQSGVGYKCQGDMSEWTKCQVVTANPKRGAFKVFFLVHLNQKRIYLCNDFNFPQILAEIILHFMYFYQSLLSIWNCFKESALT